MKNKKTLTQSMKEKCFSSIESTKDLIYDALDRLKFNNPKEYETVVEEINVEKKIFDSHRKLMEVASNRFQEIEKGKNIWNPKESKLKQFIPTYEQLQEINKIEFKTNTEEIKPNDRIDWEDCFMAFAKIMSMRSKDPNTQVGACIVRDNIVLSSGYNGFPRNQQIDFPLSRESENKLYTKYPYIVHAELNAILNARVPLDGATLYVTMFPCNECAKAIIQAGIKEVIFLENKYPLSNETIAAITLFKYCGVELKEYTNTINIEIGK